MMSSDKVLVWTNGEVVWLEIVDPNERVDLTLEDLRALRQNLDVTITHLEEKSK